MADNANTVNIPVGIDLSNFKTGISQIDAAFQQATNTAKTASNTTKTAFDNSKKAMVGANAAIIDINNSIRTWEKEIKKATDPATIQRLQNKISEAKHEINNIHSSTQKAGNSIKEFSNNAQHEMTRIGEAIIAAFAFHAIKEFVASSVEAFKKAEEAAIRLEVAYEGNKAGLKEIKLAADEAQKKLNIPHEVFETQAAFLKMQGRSTEEIKKIITTAQGLKTALGIDLQGAVLQLNLTYEGQLGRLAKLSSGLKELTDTELMNGAAVDQMYEKYGKLGEEMAGTTLGQVEKAEIGWENLKEGLGRAVTELLNVTGILPKINEQFELMIKNLNDDRLSEFDKLATGATNQLQYQATQRETYIKTQILNYKMAAKFGNEAAKEEALQTLGAIKNDEEWGLVYKHVIQDIKDLNAKHVEEVKQLSEEELKARKKAAEEWAKANEELYAKLRSMQVENQTNRHRQLFLQEEDEINSVKKSIGNEETKQKIIYEINEKYLKLRLKLDEGYDKKMLDRQDIVLKENEKLIEESVKNVFKDFKDRSEETYKELSKEDKDKINLANLLGIELENGDELDKLKEVFNKAYEYFNQYVQGVLELQVKAKEERLKNIDEEISANEKAIEKEQKDSDAGRNNNLTAEKNNQLLLKKEREKAVKELENAKKRELIINSSMEASNMAVAISKAFKEGGVAGIALSAIMVAAFLASKANAIKDIKSTKYAKGGAYILKV